MFIQSKRQSVDVRAPAKINLFVELTKKRPDGYHEIETVMTPVSIFDELRFTPRSDQSIKFELVNTLADNSQNAVPENENNLVVAAIERLRADLNLSLGADIRLTKRIPVQAGLGGGSSDAAAALLAANRAWDLNLSPRYLHDIAASLGSDVPFFLERGAKICHGRGELLKPLGPMTRLWLVVVKPTFGLSTPKVYEKVTIPAKPRQSANLLRAWKTAKINKLGQSLFNQLQIAAQKLSPDIKQTNDKLSHLPNCVSALLSGSGSSFFALFRKKIDAMRAENLLRGLRVFESVFCCQTI